MSLKKFLATKETTAKPHVASLGGTDFEFYHIRVRALIAARDVIHEVAQAVSLLFDPSAKNYVKQAVVSEVDPETKQPINSTVIEAISPVTAKQRQDAQNKAVTQAIDSLLTDEQIGKVAALVLDSLREDGTSPEQFVESVSVHDMVWFVRQMIEANLHVFAGFRGKVKEILDQRRGMTVVPEGDESPEPESAETPEIG